LAACLLAVAGARAQAPAADLMDETRRMREVAVRQVEADVRLALSEAGRTAETDRPKAIEQYKAILKKLDADNLLAEERKAALARVVQDRIRVAEAGSAGDAETAAERKAREAIEKLQKLNAEKETADRAKIKSGIDAVAALKKEGKIAEAAKQAKELLKQYPDDLSVQVLNGISSAENQIKDAKAVQTEKDDRRVAAIRDIDRSATAPIGDIEYPKDWKEKSARRLKAQQLS